MPSQERARRHESLLQCAFACGTRAAYVRGCRCEACRAANTAYAREREARRRRELAERLVGNVDEGQSGAAQVVREWTPRGGRRRLRRYSRPCPGLGGGPCAWGSYLRKDSFGGICHECRNLATRDDLVSTSRARAHLLWLRGLGVGRNSVSEASGISRSLVHAIASGAVRQVRARTERALLAVDESCRADGALVPAAPAWRNVRRLLAAGWSRAAIAQALGNETPALQVGRGAVRLRTADRLARLADHVESQRAPRAAAKAQLERLVAGARCPRCGESHEGDPLAARWCLDHQAVPLTAVEALNTAPGASPGAAHVTQEPRKEHR